MTLLLRRVESALSQAVIWLHDIARATRDEGVSAALRRIAHDVSTAAASTRVIMHPEKKDEE
jgi:hypothetical protein